MIEDRWYKNTVIYSLDVETFMDANGDGVGDFEGLMRRLDYLDSIGVETIWLAPFYPSPNRDNGYDISDFYGVDPRHGSNGDFIEFTMSFDEMKTPEAAAPRLEQATTAAGASGNANGHANGNRMSAPG